MNTTHKVKTCPCKQCKRGRHLFRRIIERKARRKWNLQTKKITDEVLSDIGVNTILADYGGGYTD